jgi:hypothetical protein
MNMQRNVKAISTLIIIILMIVSAIVGGIISYAFTIAYYAKKPEKTTLAITGVYINKENVSQFTISVLNPSYSPTNATISRIAISLKGEMQLYDVIGTEPPIENGLTVPVGESKNITCTTIKKDNATVRFGELIGSFGFAGKTIIVHIFSSDSAAANMETTLPFVQINMNVNFNPSVSVKKLNVTMTNDQQSAVNVTIKDVEIWGVIDAKVDPNVREQPITIPKGESRDFRFNINWSGVSATVPLIVYTEQGYIFRKDLQLRGFSASIKSVNFDKEDTSHFSITILNSGESASYVNVTKIRCKLDNETYFDQEFNLIGVMPNTTRTFMFNWNWKDYRNRNVTVVAYFLQDFETSAYIVKTPPPIIVEVKDSIFDLRMKEQFNLTIQNHASSLEAINITQIKIKETGQVINGTTEVNPKLPYGPIAPGSNGVFQCTFNWANFIEARHYNRTLTLTIDVVTNASLERYSFDFSFILPIAELNMTVNFEYNETKYLNVTVTIKNLNYSLLNVTLSKVILTINTTLGPVEYEYVLPKNEVVIDKGGEAVFLFFLDRLKYSGNILTVTVITEELGEVKSKSTWTVP